jgi:Rrf2 family protein
MLSRKTKYGIKALVYIAKQDTDQKIAVAEISEKENISHKFLEAILVELKKAGILGSQKGKGGGYYLLKQPEEIEMSHVMRTLEGPIAMLPCVSLNYYEKCDDCPNEEACAVNHLMLQVRDKTLEILKSTTLKKLVASTEK